MVKNDEEVPKISAIGIVVVMHFDVTDNDNNNGIIHRRGLYVVPIVESTSIVVIIVGIDIGIDNLSRKNIIVRTVSAIAEPTIVITRW